MLNKEEIVPAESCLNVNKQLHIKGNVLEILCYVMLTFCWR